MTPFAVDAAALRQGPVLGRGGQGEVVEVLGVDLPGWPATEHLVAKWYLPAVAPDPAALTRLVSWRRSLDDRGRAAVDEVACWPRAVLLRDGRAAGVLLPRVPAEYTFTPRSPSGGRVTVLRELQHLIAGPALLARRGIPDTDPATRVRVLAGLASAVAFLHERDVVLGDLSVKNVLWSPVRGVYLLDCDALRLTGTNPPVRQPNSPGWDDPAFPGTQNQQSDRYKLALTVLRVLARDFHTRNPESAAGALGRELLPILRAGLHHDPAARPAARAWRDLLHRREQPTPQPKEVTDVPKPTVNALRGNRDG
ncbi:hypothetical protein [Actinophytocola gossypii]|uniref:Protein kinase domain-containing protein n=1 Tax=Actinophytocola gossypii TaxID=2812003 RepID=A0ABT2JK43_9PSEU|nr:hypothetical protein [Actinophytocola gossypii]MCT2588269.1 hypothetical protein [Actinophytocola gossypii]